MWSCPSVAVAEVWGAASPSFYCFHVWSGNVFCFRLQLQWLQSECMFVDDSLHQTQNLLHSTHFSCVCMTQNIFDHILCFN